MNRISAAVAICLAAAVAAGAILLNLPGVTGPGVNTSATEERISALELAISEEQQARQLLEDELFVLFAEIERLEGERDEWPAANSDARGSADTEVVERVQQVRAQRVTGNRRDAMMEAGLAPDRVDWIMQREQELRFESMQALYLARSAGGERTEFDPRLNPEAMLRAEIGDTEYEMYLRGNNRPTAVGIGDVMPSSPAARAGLQPGDEIVAYNGQRVFNAPDLIQQTMQTGEGTVVVDVLRDGAPLQVVVPHGPIGVEIGRLQRR